MEPLRLHLDRVASLSAEFAAAFAVEDWGRLAGLWHDLGKYSDHFQRYIRAASPDDGEPETHPGRVDHATAGAQHAARVLNDPAGRLLAYCIAGHHAGLADGETDDDACLSARLRKSVASISAAPRDLLDQPSPSIPDFNWAKSGSERAFQAAVFCRMIFSCLVDADFLATEAHMSSSRAIMRPSLPPRMSELEAAVVSHIRKLTNSAPPSGVNRRRAEVLIACLAAAERQPGFFSLTVPTGGGKTLASLAMSLHHARLHDLRRVIYAVPFTSIIEQNADVFRDAFSDLRGDIVLEHHSNLDPQRDTPRSRLASENWDAPVIITTNVQLFESLFAARTSRCRKLHRIVGSVIVLDECQSIPVSLLEPCLAILRELVRNYRCSVVLCTATRPALDARDGFGIGIEDVREVISDPLGLHHTMNRVDVGYVGRLDDEALRQQLAALPQVLCIVNTRRHAAALATALSDDCPAIHLSANMCPAHRAQVIAAIRDVLGRGDPCRVISTQLVEAGVDLDFPVVYRAMAGLDSIAQAAGRCNREGRLDRGRAFVFEPDGGVPPGELRRAADSGRELLPEYRHDLLDLEAIEAYFRLHYWKQQDEWDKYEVLRCFRPPGCNLDFRTAAERFRFIRDDQKAIVIPWREAGEELVARLRSPVPPDRATRRRAQRYIVQIPRRVWEPLEGTAVEVLHDAFPVLRATTLYDDELGLCLPADPSSVEPEALII